MSIGHVRVSTSDGSQTSEPRRVARRRRRSEERAHIRDALRLIDHAAALAGLLAQPPGVVALSGYLADRGLLAEAGPALIARLGLTVLAIGDETHDAEPAMVDALAGVVGAVLEAYHRDNPDHAGISLERLRREAAPRLPAPLLRAILGRLTNVAVEGAWVRLAAHTLVMTPEDETLWSEILPLLSGDERFRPPRVRDISKTMELDEGRVRTLSRRLQRASQADEIANDHFFPRATTAGMVSILDQISAADFRDRLGIGRKVAIQILEFFDRHGVTMRRGDARRLNPRRLDLFRPAEPASAAVAAGMESTRT